MYYLIFFLALLLGSFYNVVGLRIPKGESIVAPRSHCISCKTTLTGLDLVPVLSYVFLKGRCRHCQKSVSPIYPLFELLTAGLFVLAPFLMGWTYELVVAWTLISMLIIIVISDLHYMLIPNKILLFFFALFIVERIFIPYLSITGHLLGLVVGFLIPFLIAVISKGGMGGGDVKLFAVLGFVLGWELVIFTFFLSSLIGMIAAVIGMLFGKVKKGVPFPFGPSIALAAIIVYFKGEALLHWYFSLLY
ncbi:prepilin peptidase [Sutcliffiella rhizosphaerae]|uniref:Prepilin leader peptidase/N-methyltransferase n=1 Tax=Sutcliffiella rhizosphaerae TaxID=2880967 RepID=A0ABN8A938_9BACI|nr:A24 family peptidase [Sutcliffiella rhizosphaerae]CAG9619508.1 Type 4 prepilin-like proteins leader peptide-processing enzyme [Sutcliffiella rhizosphaerae]